MEKDTVIKIALTALLAVYLVFALAMTGMAERADHYSGLHIEVEDSLGSGFVTKDDVIRECGNLNDIILSSPRSEINLAEIEELLLEMPVVERANVATLNDGSLMIDVQPMIPVARIFEPGGNSYYINSTGKSVVANARYHVDVPIVVGNLAASGIDPVSLLPMLSYIKDDLTLNALVSTVTVNAKGDIVIIPVIRGQVINMGNTSDFDDKFNRLKTFYTEVMPIKGWNTYDTISVKWAGQVVASKRDKSLGLISLHTEDSDFDFIDDISTMIPDEDGFIDEDNVQATKNKN